MANLYQTSPILCFAETLLLVDENVSDATRNRATGVLSPEANSQEYRLCSAPTYWHLEIKVE